MKSAFEDQAPPEMAISRGQQVVLVLLLLAAAGGAFFAQRDLASVRAQRDGLLLAGRENGEPAEAPGLTPPARDLTPAGALEAATGLTPAASSPQEVRTQSLGLLGDLLSQRRIMMLSTGPMMGWGPPGRGEGSIPAHTLAPDGRLSPDFGPFFGLKETEVAALQRTAEAIKLRLDAAIRAGATVEQTGAEAYRIESQPVPDAEAMRQEFIGAFRGALGEERYRVFALLNGEREIPMEARTRVVDGVTVFNRSGPEAFFDSFGETRRVVTLTKTGGQYSVLIRTSTGSTSTSNSSSLDNVRPRMGVLAELLPPGF